MADINLVVANRISIVESLIQATIPPAETIVAGAPVRIDTTSGKFTNANATSTAEARVYGIAGKRSGTDGLTAIRKGVLDGYDLSALAYDAPVYLSNTDGRLSDTAGTTSVVIGRVISGTATTTGTAYDKLLFVDL